MVKTGAGIFLEGRQRNLTVSVRMSGPFLGQVDGGSWELLSDFIDKWNSGCSGNGSFTCTYWKVVCFTLNDGIPKEAD